MIKQNGFLVIEGVIGLTIAIMGVMLMALVLSGIYKTEKTIEQKTDRTYAWHVMRKNNLKEIEVHSRVYQLVKKDRVYDTHAKKEYKIQK